MLRIEVSEKEISREREGYGEVQQRLFCRPARRSLMRLLAWTRNRMLRTVESPAMEAELEKSFSNTLLNSANVYFDLSQLHSSCHCFDHV